MHQTLLQIDGRCAGVQHNEMVEKHLALILSLCLMAQQVSAAEVSILCKKLENPNVYKKITMIEQTKTVTVEDNVGGSNTYVNGRYRKFLGRDVQDYVEYRSDSILFGTIKGELGCSYDPAKTSSIGNECYFSDGMLDRRTLILNEEYQCRILSNKPLF